MLSEGTRHFAEELDALKHRLLEMGGLATERVCRAVQGLQGRDGALLDEVALGDEGVNRLQLEIDDRCFKLLALQQPMAVDLRTIVAALKISSDLERVGDLAVNIAEAARRYIVHPPPRTLVDLPAMPGLAEQMLRDALNAFVSRNVTAAQDVLVRDDELDGLKERIFREILNQMLSDPRVIEPGLDLILISRHLERIGDHATNVAEDIIFMVSARDVRHQALREPQ